MSEYLSFYCDYYFYSQGGPNCLYEVELGLIGDPGSCLFELPTPRSGSRRRCPIGRICGDPCYVPGEPELTGTEAIIQ